MRGHLQVGKRPSIFPFIPYLLINADSSPSNTFSLLSLKLFRLLIRGQSPRWEKALNHPIDPYRLINADSSPSNTFSLLSLKVENNTVRRPVSLFTVFLPIT